MSCCAELYDLLAPKIAKIYPQLCSIRHQLHQIPELGFKEHKTATYLAELFTSLGLSFTQGIAGTGFVVDIQGHEPGDLVAFRADIDGLRITENAVHDHCSTHEGYAHSCGHDGHTTTLIGVMMVLIACRDHFSGTVRCIFQPGEETGKGALAMIEQGILNDRMPKCIFALHCWPYIACGDVAAKAGVMTSGNELFHVTLRGSGGHGARHFEVENPLNCACKIIPQLFQLTNVESADTFVVSIGYVRGGGAPNVIPECVEFGGTMRSSTLAVRKTVHMQFEQIINDECLIEGIDSSIEFSNYCLPVVNNESMFELFETVAAQVIPQHKVQYIQQHSMGSEDFSFFSDLVPGLFFRLGVGCDSPPLHSSSFDFNDNALHNGVLFSTALVLNALNPTFEPSWRP